MFWKKRKDKADRTQTIKEPKLKTKRPRDPLIDLVFKAQSRDELKKLWDEYNERATTFFDIALFLREYQIEIKDLKKRVTMLEKKMEKGDEK